MGRTNVRADAPEQAADVQRELKELEERAEYCSRTARFYAAAHRTLAAEAARVRAALVGEAREGRNRPKVARPPTDIQVAELAPVDASAIS